MFIDICYDVNFYFLVVLQQETTLILSIYLTCGRYDVLKMHTL